MRILIIGRNEILYDTARLLSKEHTICGIITSQSSPEYLKNERDFERLAEELNCPFLISKSINKSALELIDKTKPDIGVSVNWVSVIDETVFSRIKRGILNCHPSLLPKYRGNAATNWAIILKEKEIGISIHFMQPGELDAGDIIFQSKFNLHENTTIREINNYWQSSTPQMFLNAINGLEKGEIIPIKQSDLGIRAFRAYPRLPIDSKIDWNSSAEEIHNVVRATTKPYSGAYTYLKIDDKIKKVIIWESKVVCHESEDICSPGHIIFNDPNSGESHVFTGKGILSILLAEYENEEQFQPGKKWKSIRMRFGIDIEQELINIRKRFE